MMAKKKPAKPAKKAANPASKPKTKRKPVVHEREGIVLSKDQEEALEAAEASRPSARQRS
jgi:hypothetical protein